MRTRLGPPVAAFILLSFLLALSSPSTHAGTEQETPKYIAIGDSLSFGLGASEPNQTGFVALVHSALEGSDRFSTSGIDLVNLSAPGATSPDLLQSGGQLQLALSEISRSALPPVISVTIGGNDLLDLADADSPCLNEIDTEPCLDEVGATLADLQSNLGDVLESLRSASPEAILVVVDLYNPFSGTGDIRELIADAGVQRINGVMAATASDPDLRARLATVFQSFQGRGRQWIAPDGIHPNDNGHAVIAEIVLAALDGREPRISEELLNVPPDPVSVIGAAPSSGDDGGVPVVVLVLAIVAAFVAGGALTGAFFIVRGQQA
jgi:lysophospholipase L1-like esterase